MLQVLKYFAVNVESVYAVAPSMKEVKSRAWIV